MWPKSQLSIQSSLICCAYGGLSSTSIFVYTAEPLPCAPVWGHLPSHSLQVSQMFIRLTRGKSTVLLVACYPSSCPLPLIHGVDKSNSCRKSAKEISTGWWLFMWKWKLYLRTEKLTGQNLPLTISILLKALLSCQIVPQNNFLWGKFGQYLIHDTPQANGRYI